MERPLWGRAGCMPGGAPPNMPRPGAAPPSARRAPSWRSPLYPPLPWGPLSAVNSGASFGVFCKSGGRTVRRALFGGARGAAGPSCASFWRHSGLLPACSGAVESFVLVILHFFSSSLKYSGDAIFHLAPHPLPQAQDQASFQREGSRGFPLVCLKLGVGGCG